MASLNGEQIQLPFGALEIEDDPVPSPVYRRILRAQTVREVRAAFRKDVAPVRREEAPVLIRKRA